MRKLSNLVLNILLALGLLFLLGGFLLFVYALENDHARFFRFWPLFITVSGLLLTYFSVVCFHKSYLLFSGIMISLSGCLSMFLATDITSLGYSELWPVFLSIAGVSLLLSCAYKFRRPRPNYLVPSMAMIGLSVLFLMFSLNVIKISFVSFIVMVGPFLLFGAGITVVILFIVQSAHKELVVPEEDSDNDA